MDHLGACPVCGRPRTTTPRGAPVSCCSRAVLAPVTPRRASSIPDALTALADRALLRVPTWLPVGCLTAAGVAALLVFFAWTFWGR